MTTQKSLEETRRQRRSTTGSAFVSSTRHDKNHLPDKTPSLPPQTPSRPFNNRGKGGRGGRFPGGKGRGYTSGNPSQNSPSGWTWMPFQPWGQPPTWTPPPCPYPTTPWTPPNNSTPGAGVLGPRPQQAFAAQSTPAEAPNGLLVPTDIALAMQTLSLQPPDDNWYMDTGATSHMTSDPGLSDGKTPYEMQ
ncbi:splicing factor 1-like [Asparagus officinalis]|uniref:splicing factor 1-like n=1 Tax=Asparagus officinalis TaxID=4686 RepID=UPI00098E1A82|nr:splicing factor 1-like [Asparagus officinalis]